MTLARVVACPTRAVSPSSTQTWCRLHTRRTRPCVELADYTTAHVARNRADRCGPPSERVNVRCAVMCSETERDIRVQHLARFQKWTVVIDVGRGADGKRVRKWHSWFPTRKAAEQARTKLLASLDAGAYVPPTKLTLRGFLLEKWLPTITTTVRPTTAAMYRTNVEAHIVPKLGHIELRNLAPDALNRFYAESLSNGRRDGNGGLSARTVRILHVLLHRAYSTGALRDATKWGITARNVAELADPPKVKATEGACWAPEQTTTFLASTAAERLAALWHLAAATGMRRGEILGLRWSDVDLDAGSSRSARPMSSSTRSRRCLSPRRVLADALWRSIPAR